MGSDKDLPKQKQNINRNIGVVAKIFLNRNINRNRNRNRNAHYYKETSGQNRPGKQKKYRDKFAITEVRIYKALNFNSNM